MNNDNSRTNNNSNSMAGDIHHTICIPAYETWAARGDDVDFGDEGIVGVQELVVRDSPTLFRVLTVSGMEPRFQIVVPRNEAEADLWDRLLWVGESVDKMVRSWVDADGNPIGWGNGHMLPKEQMEGVDWPKVRHAIRTPKGDRVLWCYDMSESVWDDIEYSYPELCDRLETDDILFDDEGEVDYVGDEFDDDGDEFDGDGDETRADE